MKTKTLIVLRGLPCIERDELAHTLGKVVHRIDESQYQSINIDNEDQVAQLHDDLLCRVENNMVELDGPLVVCGPMTYNWEVEQYLDLADKHKYELMALVHTCTVEDSSLSKLISPDILNVLADRFELAL